MPTITNLNPASGPTSGGNQVVVTGTGLASTTSVHFGASAVSFVGVSNTQVNAFAPPGAGTVQVNVTTVAGTSNSLPYTYVPAPILTSLNPTSGPAAGGSTVVLAGTNFSNVTTVRFGANAAAFTVVSSTQIVAVAPAGSGTVPVTVTTLSGTSNSVSYTYVPTPVVTSISPEQGPLPGGNTVTLTGSGFTGAVAVTFGAVAAASFTVVDSSHITVTVPGGNQPGPVQVTVTTMSGTSNGVSYFHLVQPAVVAVAPNQGPLSGGDTVTITGGGFTGASAVVFGATSAGSFTVVSDNQITAVAPAGTGAVQVTVTTPGGVSSTSASSAYTYLSGPTVSGLTPNQGPTAGGNAVTLSGANPTFATAVRFGATPAPFTVVSGTQIVAQAPPGAAGPVAVTVTTPGGTSAGVTYTYVAAPGS
ncbi:MAG TPA: IPT/TIG domain-containing protein [Amycolatopsis sp.]|uniref:IPT/TIG domain-containing protein n=1 Tax=Amycolatopsis sp. TaxID=37632 RepID=UPI002B45EBE3|nr:IPT/TIG domain-containing protein [Amycolatopsis sp.]HKS47876.1 IPT/TIG domain-containing protein [Amycolatopsis sp.]